MRGVSASPGYARNLADGRVEVVASGDEAALARLEELLRGGPANAQRDRRRARRSVDEPPLPTRSFDIR